MRILNVPENLMFQVRCPVCGRGFDSDQSETMPFCSERCRTIDLHRWLEERYGLPRPPEDDPEDPNSPQKPEPKPES